MGVVRTVKPKVLYTVGEYLATVAGHQLTDKGKLRFQFQILQGPDPRAINQAVYRNFNDTLSPMSDLGKFFEAATGRSLATIPPDQGIDLSVLDRTRVFITITHHTSAAVGQMNSISGFRRADGGITPAAAAIPSVPQAQVPMQPQQPVYAPAPQPQVFTPAPQPQQAYAPAPAPAPLPPQPAAAAPARPVAATPQAGAPPTALTF